MHEDFTRWTDFIDAISLDLLGLTYPDACIGSMGDRLLLAGLWPILSIMLGGAALACCCHCCCALGSLGWGAACENC